MSDLFAELRARCDRHLDRVLPNAGDGRLAEAMRYAVLGGGKRLRPLLVYAAGAAFGAAPERLDNAAAAVELIHAYSLVHDDLPAMDDDDLRRGRPTVHRAFDEATAILVGDALQALAFEVLAESVGLGIAPATVVAMSTELARASGAAGMVGGQALDLALVGRTADLDTLVRMHGLKTGALIRAAARLGALAAGAGESALAALARYARDLGLAFQIQDDVLDEIGDSAVTGKAVGADRERGKPTFTRLLGVESAHAQAERLLDSALQALRELDADTGALASLAHDLVRRDA